MNKLVLAAALGLSLAACDNAADEAATADETAAPAEAAAAAMTSANGSEPGVFEVTAADGTVTQTELVGDGTYMDHGADGAVTAQGKWSVVDGKTCFDPDGDEAATCYAESAPDADGKFTATPDEGDAVTVRRVG
jgi:hypothetical protein